MKYFKTRGERIYLAITIGFIFCFYSWIIFTPNELRYMELTDIPILLFITISPFVPYTMYKLIFYKEEKKS